jgi:type IV pilus assembly protein PilA
LAAIAIPTFLGQRNKANDAAAKSLVRNAMTAVEASYVDNQTFAIATMTAGVLGAIEPSINWVVAASAAAGAQTAAAGAALASANQVAFYGTASDYQLSSQSKSGTIFGVDVNKVVAADTLTNTAGNFFYVGAVKKSW